MKNTGRLFIGFFLTISLLAVFSPPQAQAFTREESREMKKKLHAEDLQFQKVLRQKLLLIDIDRQKKARALLEQLASQKKGSENREQHKIYWQQYQAKLKEVRVESHVSRIRTKQELHDIRKANRRQIEESYADAEEDEERLHGEAGFRG